MPDRTRNDPSLWCPPCAAGNCPGQCAEGCHHVCDIEALWRLAGAALHDRLFGYPVGDHREGPQWDEAQSLAGLVLHAIPEGWVKTDGEWRPLRTLWSRLRFVLHSSRAEFLSTWARAMRRKGSYLSGPEAELEHEGCSKKTLIDLDTSVRPGGIMGLFIEDLSDDELDGLACVECGRRGDPMVPVVQGPRGQLFACEYGCGQGPGYTEPPLDWDPDEEPCSTCRGVGSGCTCCQNCGAPNGRGRFGFCNGCAPFFDPHAAGCTCGDCPQTWGSHG